MCAVSMRTNPVSMATKQSPTRMTRAAMRIAHSLGRGNRASKGDESGRKGCRVVRPDQYRAFERARRRVD